MVAAAGISLAAVGAFIVSRVVLSSRVGASSGGGRYLSELAAVERMASAASPRTMIARVTHPFGEADDTGCGAALWAAGEAFARCSTRVASWAAPSVWKCVTWTTTTSP